MTQHKCQASAWALEGKEPLGEAHRHPADLLDLRFEDPIALDPDIVIPKAQKPVFDEGAHVRPDPWPSPGANTTDLDVYQRASVLLEGEQNLFLPCVGSEQYAAQPAPQIIFPILLSLDTHACSIVPGEGTTPVQRTTNLCLEVLKPPCLCEDPPDEAGGVGLGPVHVAGKVGTEAIEHAVVDVHESGGVSLDTDATPAPTEGTASVKLFGMAKKAATAEPEALEPRAEGEVWRGLKMLPLPLSQEDSGKSRMPLREAPTEGMCWCRLEAPLRPPQGSPSKGKCGPKRAPRETP